MVAYEYVPLESMTPSQLEKRRQVLSAVIRLLEEHHPERLSVKMVAEESGVALGTIYRFFTTKDHLLASVLLHWESPLVEATEAVSVPAPSNLGEAEEWIMGVVRRGTRAYQQNPNMLALLVNSATTLDPYASEVMAEVRLATRRALVSRLGAPSEHTLAYSETVQAIWFDFLVHWHVGRRSVAEGLEQMAHAVSLLSAGVRELER